MRAPFLVLACASLSAVSLTAQWQQFRGPSACCAVEKSGVPLPFDLKQHVAFQVEVPKGHSSPVIAGDRLFLTGAEGEELWMLCLDRRDGKTLWKRSATARQAESYGHRASELAMPSACTDGERVFFSFGPYGLIALEAATGKQLWEQQLPLAQHEFGTGASPILVDDLVIVQRDGAPDSSIVAFDQADGKERWRNERLGFISSYTTPYLWERGGKRELIVAGTGAMTALDPKTGKNLWEVKDLTMLACTSPVADQEQIYFAGWSSPGAVGAELFDSIFGEDFVLSAAEIKDPGLIFERLDADKNGVLKPSELPAGSRVADAFQAFDANADGVWQADEMLPFLRRSQARGRNIAVAVRDGGQR